MCIQTEALRPWGCKSLFNSAALDTLQPTNGVDGIGAVEVIDFSPAEKAEKPYVGAFPGFTPYNGDTVDLMGMQFDELKAFKKRFRAAPVNLRFNGQEKADPSPGLRNAALQHSTQLPGLTIHHPVEEADRDQGTDTLEGNGFQCRHPTLD